MQKYPRIAKLISFILIGVILFFLVKGLKLDWILFLEHQFSYDYRWLLLSFFAFCISISSFGLVWNQILLALDKERKISNFEAVKIYIFSQFGRYLPGKAWFYLGKIYLGEKAGLNRKILAVSAVYEIILSVSSAFLLSLIILIRKLGSTIISENLAPILVIILALIGLHPKIFHFVFKKIGSLVGYSELPVESFLSYSKSLLIVISYSTVTLFNGIAFFFFLRSFIDLPFSVILEIAGFFVLSSVLGMVAVFAPGGIGVREGFLSYFLGRHLANPTNIFASLAVRVWVTVIEIFLFIFFWSLDKLKVNRT